MKPLFNLEYTYYRESQHLSQIYDGFEKLKEQGIVSITKKFDQGSNTTAFLEVILNNKYKIVYDTQDGLNWIKGSLHDNLSHFQNNINADFYFKRSYSDILLDHIPKGCSVLPLGLNYQIKVQGVHLNIKDQIKTYILKRSAISNLLSLKRGTFFSSEFEALPIPPDHNKILFLTRLWDPDEVSQSHLKIEREQINTERINYIKACKNEFGSLFIGGLYGDLFSNKKAKEYIMPNSLTKKQTFLKTIKDSAICVGTKGLHDSIGWKFGEYVAASRAIVSEPLAYTLPGDFNSDKNYLAFLNEDELIGNIQELLNNKNLTINMMLNNHRYYQNFVKPDMLVLNTLLYIYESIE